MMMSEGRDLFYRQIFDSITQRQVSLIKMSAIKESVKNAMEYSTFHAIPNIARTKRTSVKVMWILILILSSTVCSYLVFKTIVQYFSFEVVTKFSVVYENPTKFPTVTVCNLNPYVTDSAFEFFGEYFTKLGFNETHQPSFGLKSESKFIDQFYDLKAILFMALGHKIESKLSKLKLESFGLAPEKFFIICAFLSEECNYTQMRWFYDPIYGNCWTFNPVIICLNYHYAFLNFMYYFPII